MPVLLNYGGTSGELLLSGKRYAEEQIISIIKSNEAGAPVTDLTRQHGMVEKTIYRCKFMYSGMDGSEAKKLREL